MRSESSLTLEGITPMQKIGLAADIGSLQRLPRIIGNDSMARELAYTGREFNAEQAQAMGLLSRVVDGGREAVIGECAGA